MRTYETGPDGEICFRGDGDGVALQHPGTATPSIICEAFQQTYDAGYQAALRDACERLGDMLNGMPEQIRPYVRSSTRPNTRENWNQ